MIVSNERSKNLTSLMNQKNFDEIYLINSEKIIKKDIIDNISPQAIMNLKKIKNRLNLEDDKSNNKYIEEKSSERNALGDYLDNSIKKLNPQLNKINNGNLINEENTIIENNEMELEKTIHFNKEKTKTINKNIILDLNSSEEKNDKIKVNKVFNKSISKNGIKIIKKEEKKIYKCLFCEKICSNNLYNSLFTCPHFFCMDCGKNFFEEIINISIKLKDKNIKSNALW